MDVTLLRFDTVRSALALAAFGVTGCLAWFQGDADAVTRPADAGADAVVDAGPVAPRDASVPPPGDVPAVDAPLVPPGDPATRSVATTCAQWRAASASIAGLGGWRPGASACDQGSLPPETRAGALRLTNAYRWLAGLAPLRDDAAQTAAAQACAVLVERNGQLNHTPPMTWTCWSALGYQGTSSSNITGVRGFTMTVRDAINGWIDDSRDLSHTLGHRRWMLYPPLSSMGYGQASSYACLYILGANDNPRPSTYVPWPNAGPTPADAMTRIWSFSSAALGVTAATRVEVTRDGAAVPVTAALRTGNYGDPTVSWDMPAIAAGSVYAVRVSGLAGADVRYEVRPVACE